MERCSVGFLDAPRSSLTGGFLFVLEETARATVQFSDVQLLAASFCKGQLVTPVTQPDQRTGATGAQHMPDSQRREACKEVVDVIEVVNAS
jgi:hypothetical protein